MWIFPNILHIFREFPPIYPRLHERIRWGLSHRAINAQTDIWTHEYDYCFQYPTILLNGMHDFYMGITMLCVYMYVELKWPQTRTFAPALPKTRIKLYHLAAHTTFSYIWRICEYKMCKYHFCIYENDIVILFWYKNRTLCMHSD